MKRPRFYIRLSILIPLIFVGLVILASTLSYQIITGSTVRGTAPFLPFTFSLVGLAAAAMVCGLLVVRILLKPVEIFAEKARQLPILTQRDTYLLDSEAQDEITRYSRLFSEVTDVLDNIEARHLFPEIIGESRLIRGVFSHILKAAPTNATVLLSGESGTGKELVAAAIHRLSGRRDQPFVTINCAAIPAGLLESELFGHEKGAFTDALSTRKGRFELADGGTLFLDEIGDMPLETQVKILRVLEEMTFMRVGGTESKTVDVRIIAATNQDFGKLLASGSFREDLFHRLNVFPVHLPPLRQRREDIPLLVNAFLQKTPDIRVSANALQAMMGYSWPGNIRELHNMLERASLLCENGVVELHNLQFLIHPTRGGEAPQRFPVSLDQKVREFEKKMIVEALSATGGIQVKAAEMLGINQRSLWHRIKKHDINVEMLKNSKY